MKKTCFVGRLGTCRALELWDTMYRCSLGYKIEQVYDRKMLIFRNPKPAESCPKPRTNAELSRAMNGGKEKET